MSHSPNLGGSGGALCRNCGAELSGRFCAVCGQDGSRTLRSFPALVRGVARDLVDLDGRLVQTMKTLVLRPGRLTSEYAEGKRAGRVSPARLYLVSAAVFFFVAPRLDMGRVQVSTEGGRASYFTFGPLTWDSELLLLVLVPVWGFVVFWSLRRRMRYYEEAFVFSVHYHVFFLLCMFAVAAASASVLALAGPVAAVWTVVAGAFLPLPYLSRALGVVFDLPPARRRLAATLLFLAHLMIGQLLFNAMTGARGS